MPDPVTIALAAWPTLIAAVALTDRARARRRFAWPTTAARLVESGDGYAYTVRGRTYVHALAPTGDGTTAPSAEARIHYDPLDPQRSVMPGAPLPAVAAPVLRAAGAALVVAAAIHWLA